MLVVDELINTLNDFSDENLDIQYNSDSIAYIMYRITSYNVCYTKLLRIGVPADNVQIYLLDKLLKPLPIGSIGEMYVSGDGVARGYLNRDELTKERFIENPFVRNNFV